MNRIRRASNKAQQQQTQAPPQSQPAPQPAPQPQQAPSAAPLYYSKPPGEPPPAPAVVNAPSLEYRPSPVKLERAVLAKADGSGVLQLPQHKLQVAPSAGSQSAPAPVAAPAASAGPVRRKVPPSTERLLNLVPFSFQTCRPTGHRIERLRVSGRTTVRVLLLRMVGRRQLVPEATSQHASQAVRVLPLRVQGGTSRAAGHTRAQGAQQKGLRQVPFPRR